MLRPSVNTFRVSLVTLALLLALPLGAEERPRPSSLVGLSKDQVYSQLGEPRSQLRAGAREIMFFAKVKVTFRNGIVIETEPLVDDTAPKRAPEIPASAATNAGDGSEVAKAGNSAALPASPAPDGSPTAGAAAPAEVKTSAPADTGGLEIKFVRGPAKNAPRPTPRSAIAPAAPATASTGSVTATSAPTPSPRLSVEGAAATTGNVSSQAALQPKAVALPTVPPDRSDGTTTPVPSTVSAAPPTAPTEATADVAPAEEAKPKVAPKRRFRRSAALDPEVAEVPLFTAQSYVLAVAIVGAVAFLIWRGRQRRLELAATTVSNTPFSEAAPIDNAVLFSADLLRKLEWKRFEVLVAAYYVKTGVVAVRTQAGPQSAVHLNISWKGETKPFACVQCHSNPKGLIMVEPLQELNAALTAADIRRGYVVTNGKFNVEARDFAEEKHFTLLPGDLFLEKLNALPPAARAELMQETTAGDYSTPTCPKCDVKMIQAAEGGWRCANHPKCEVTITAGAT
jgi:hypothetical protein